MPAPPDGPDPNRNPAALDGLTRRAVAAKSRRLRTKIVKALARRAARGNTVSEVFRRLLSGGAAGQRAALEFYTRLPDAPAAFSPAVLALLKQKVATVGVELAAAGRLLAATPDLPETVRPVLAALTVGLSRHTALERLVRLQAQVRRSTALDRMIAATEAKLPLKCPKCPTQSTRSELIRHLWHAHRLIWTDGKVRSPESVLERSMRLATSTPAAVDPLQVDEAFEKTAQFFPDVSPRQVFQAFAARGAAHPTQLGPLLESAADDRCGLCPVCLSALPDPIPALPAAAAVGGGRLAAEGYEVETSDSVFGRRVVVTSRDGVPTDLGRRLPPRLSAVVAAGPILLAAAGATAVLAQPWARLFGTILAIGAWGTYAGVRLTRKPLPDPADEAVDRAWGDVVPGIGRKLPAVRFLTRLCRASIGAGNPVDRTPAVWELVEQAAVLADRGGVHLQLLAAARILQACDGAAAGRERVAGLVKVFEPFFRGELPLAYAEAAAEILSAAEVSPGGEARRLAVLLTGQAFESGFLPIDITIVTRFAPYLSTLLGHPTDLHLNALYTVWRGRHQRRWAEVGPAETVFELAENSPTRAKKTLAEYPDTLLHVETDATTDEAVGPLLVCSTGVAAGEAVVADPDADVRLSPNGRELLFGSRRIGLGRKLSSRAALAVRGWLKYRGNVLMPQAQRSQEQTKPSRAPFVLSPLTANCPLCGTASLVRTGQVGVT